MAPNDFYLDFGSNAAQFARDLTTELAPVKREISALRTALAATLSEARGVAGETANIRPGSPGASNQVGKIDVSGIDTVLKDILRDMSTASAAVLKVSKDMSRAAVEARRAQGNAAGAQTQLRGGAGATGSARTQFARAGTEGASSLQQRRQELNALGLTVERAMRGTTRQGGGPPVTIAGTPKVMVAEASYQNLVKATDRVGNKVEKWGERLVAAINRNGGGGRRTGGGSSRADVASEREDDAFYQVSRTRAQIAKRRRLQALQREQARIAAGGDFDEDLFKQASQGSRSLRKAGVRNDFTGDKYAGVVDKAIAQVTKDLEGIPRLRQLQARLKKEIAATGTTDGRRPDLNQGGSASSDTRRNTRKSREVSQAEQETARAARRVAAQTRVDEASEGLAALKAAKATLDVVLSDQTLGKRKRSEAERGIARVNQEIARLERELKTATKQARPPREERQAQHRAEAAQYRSTTGALTGQDRANTAARLAVASDTNTLTKLLKAELQDVARAFTQEGFETPFTSKTTKGQLIERIRTSRAALDEAGGATAHDLRTTRASTVMTTEMRKAVSKIIGDLRYTAQEQLAREVLRANAQAGGTVRDDRLNDFFRLGTTDLYGGNVRATRKGLPTRAGQFRDQVPDAERIFTERFDKVDRAVANEAIRRVRTGAASFDPYSVPLPKGNDEESRMTAYGIRSMRRFSDALDELARKVHQRQAQQAAAGATADELSQVMNLKPGQLKRYLRSLGIEKEIGNEFASMFKNGVLRMEDLFSDQFIQGMARRAHSGAAFKDERAISAEEAERRLNTQSRAEQRKALFSGANETYFGLDQVLNANSRQRAALLPGIRFNRGKAYYAPDYQFQRDESGALRTRRNAKTGVDEPLPADPGLLQPIAKAYRNYKKKILDLNEAIGSGRPDSELAELRTKIAQAEDRFIKRYNNVFPTLPAREENGLLTYSPAIRAEALKADAAANRKAREAANRARRAREDEGLNLLDNNGVPLVRNLDLEQARRAGPKLTQAQLAEYSPNARVIAAREARAAIEARRGALDPAELRPKQLTKAIAAIEADLVQADRRLRAAVRSMTPEERDQARVRARAEELEVAGDLLARAGVRFGEDLNPTLAKAKTLNQLITAFSEAVRKGTLQLTSYTGPTPPDLRGRRVAITASGALTELEASAGTTPRVSAQRTRFERQTTALGTLAEFEARKRSGGTPDANTAAVKENTRELRTGKRGQQGPGGEQCCERIVSKLNQIHDTLKGGIRVSAARPDQAGATAAEKLNSRPGRSKSLPTVGADYVRFPQSNIDEFYQSLERGTEQQRALGRAARTAATDEERLAAGIDLVRSKTLTQELAVQLLRQQYGLSTKEAQAFARELERGVAGANLSSRPETQQRAAKKRAAIEAAEAERKLGAETTRTTVATNQAAQAEAYLTDKTRKEINELTKLAGIHRQLQVEHAQNPTPSSQSALAESSRLLVAQQGRVIGAAREDFGNSRITAGSQDKLLRGILGTATGVKVTKKDVDLLGQQVVTKLGESVKDQGSSQAEFVQSNLMRSLFGSHGFASRVLNSFGTFIVRNFSAGLVFGLTNALQDAIAQAIETESTFVRVSEALEKTGRSSNGLRTSLQGLSQEYGVALKDVYTTAAGLTGLFDASDVGNKQLLALTRVAVQLQIISGGALNATEAMKSLASVTSAYANVSAQQIADVATTIQNMLGVNIEETIEGVARLSGQAAELGISFEAVASLVAGISKFTNQTGAASGEQLSRILAQLQTGQVQSLVARTVGGQQGAAIQAAFDTGDTQEGIFGIARAWSSLSREQRNSISVAIGGQRQAAAINAIFTDGDKILGAYTRSLNSQGAAEERAAKIAEQLNNQFARLQQAFVNFFAVLTRTGILNGLLVGLKLVSGTLGTINSVMSTFLELVDSNVVTRGLKNIAVGVAGVYGAVLLLRKAWIGFQTAVGASRTFSAVTQALATGTSVAEVAAQRAANQQSGRAAIFGSLAALPNFIRGRRAGALDAGRYIPNVQRSSIGPQTFAQAGLLGQAFLGGTEFFPGTGIPATRLGRFYGARAASTATVSARLAASAASAREAQLASTGLSAVRSGAVATGARGAAGLFGGVSAGLAGLAAGGVAATGGLLGAAAAIGVMVDGLLRIKANSDAFDDLVDRYYEVDKQTGARGGRSRRPDDEFAARAYDTRRSFGLNYNTFSQSLASVFGPGTALQNVRRYGPLGLNPATAIANNLFPQVGQSLDQGRRLATSLPGRIFGAVPGASEARRLLPDINLPNLPTPGFVARIRGDATGGFNEAFAKVAEASRQRLQGAQGNARAVDKASKENNRRIRKMIDDIIDDPSLSAPQKTTEIGRLRTLQTKLATNATQLRLVAEGASRLNVLTVDQAQGIGNLVSSIATLSATTRSEFSKTIQTSVEELGIKTGSDYDRLLQQLSGGGAQGPAQQIQTQRQILERALQATQTQIDQLPVGSEKRSDLIKAANGMIAQISQLKTQELQQITADAQAGLDNLRYLGDYEGAAASARTLIAAYQQQFREGLISGAQFRSLTNQANQQAAEDAAKAATLGLEAQRPGTRGSLASARLDRQIADARLKALQGQGLTGLRSERQDGGAGLGAASAEQIAAARAAATTAALAEADAVESQRVAAVNARIAGIMGNAARAQAQEGEAWRALTYAKLSYGEDSVEYQNALAAAIQASQAAEAAQRSLVVARQNLSAAQILNDVRRAQAQEAAAWDQVNYAREHLGEEDYIAAVTAAVQSSQATMQALRAQVEASQQTALARLAPSDELGRASLSLQIARDAQNYARQFGTDSVQYQSATQAVIEAQRGVTTAVRNIADANKNLGLALANAAGDMVAAARISLDVARAELARALRDAKAGVTTALATSDAARAASNLTGSGYTGSYASGTTVTSGRAPSRITSAGIQGIAPGGVVTQQFGNPSSRYKSGFHQGVDIGVPIGTPIYSASSGEVISAKDEGAYGNSILIQGDDGRTYRYGHLSAFGVRAGDRIEQGQFIGKSGNTGNSTGPHLHFEVKNRRGRAIDPTPYLPGGSTGRRRRAARGANRSSRAIEHYQDQRAQYVKKVEALQRELIRRGARIRVTGKMDAPTRLALRRFGRGGTRVVGEDENGRLIKQSFTQLVAPVAPVRPVVNTTDSSYDDQRSYGTGGGDPAPVDTSGYVPNPFVTKKQYRRAIRSGNVAVINAVAGVATAEAALRDAKLQDATDTIDFNREMGNITAKEAIAQLQQLLLQKNLTEQQRRSLLLKIKGLQDELSDQFEGVWNIGTITLPTPYEMRRALGVDQAQTAVQQAIVSSLPSGTATGTTSAGDISADSSGFSGPWALERGFDGHLTRHQRRLRRARQAASLIREGGFADGEGRGFGGKHGIGAELLAAIRAAGAKQDVHIAINGADVAMVRRILSQYLGPQATGRAGTHHRKR